MTAATLHIAAPTFVERAGLRIADAITARVRDLQQDYLRRCIPRDLESFQNRPLRERLMENIALLVGPLL